MRIDDNVIHRFWSKVNKDGPTQPHMSTPCWTWSAAKGSHGYGYFGVDNRCYLTHRVSVAIDGRDINGKVVMHDCDTPACVNPSHLVTGTHTDNMHDMIAKGRARKASGEDASNAKLANDQYSEIARRYCEGERAVVLAREFGINRQTVALIANRLSPRGGVRRPLRDFACARCGISASSRQPAAKYCGKRCSVDAYLAARTARRGMRLRVVGE
jgi:hypothetical protein